LIWRGRRLFTTVSMVRTVKSDDEDGDGEALQVDVERRRRRKRQRRVDLMLG
jgi:hypothetical protein